jgi:hypothetical protein
LAPRLISTSVWIQQLLGLLEAQILESSQKTRQKK